MTRVLIFPGCLYADELPEVAQRYRRLLGRMGFDALVFEQPHCCGYPYRDLGRKDLFLKSGQKLVARLHDHAPALIVNLCPTCNRHFEKHLKRDCGLGRDIEVRHVTTFLAQHLDRLELRPTDPTAERAVGYQDPCWLGRRTGDVDSPRRLLQAAGFEVRDGPASRRLGGCCGHAGLVPHHHPELAAEVAARRLGYFSDLQLSEVITSCPRCYRGLRAASLQRGTGLVVRDLSEILSDPR